MAQLIPPAQSPSSTRVSHLLPTVKCSNCAQPVPLSSLSDHVCRSQQPPRPQQLQQPQPPQQSQQFQQSHRQQQQHHQLPRPQQPRLRSGSQSRPSDVYVPRPSQVPFPSVATPPPKPEDYMPGGASGMAGVGRRAFQAAAHAAVFAHHLQGAEPEPPSGMQTRRANPPRFLDIGIPARGTPPLSPNSTHSSARSHSPPSPLFQSPLTTSPVIAPSRTPSPAPPTPMSRSYLDSSRSPLPRSNPPPTPTVSSRLPFLQRYKDAKGQTPPTSPTPIPKNDSFYPSHTEPKSPRDSDGSDYGLAYDRDDDDDDEGGILSRLNIENDRTSTSSHSAYSAASASKTRFTRDDLPSSPRRSHTTPTVGPRGGAGGLPSPLVPSSPPAVGAARSASDAKNLRREKEESRSRPRVCIRCDRNIDDGRWINTDSKKGVLCERCWKNMYLPKCRRCNKPIEKAAVYSSDGQLKGKYHRECFNCHTCHKPFPDKSFYVYDGHPMCAFHYHEANRSLCTARICGKPIEGPCAITFSGDRFHPDCLRCAHSGCEERLDDYWEVDGMMFCERHAQREQDIEDEDEMDDFVGELGRIPSIRRPPRFGSGETRAQKRTTRLINLTGPGFGAL